MPIKLTSLASTIAVLYSFYFILAFILLFILDKLLGEVKPTFDNPTYIIILELLLFFFIFGITVHYVQLFVNKYIDPYGDPTDFSTGTWVLIITFFACSVNIQDRLYILYNRIMGTDYPLIYGNVKNRQMQRRRQQPVPDVNQNSYGNYL